MTHAVKEVARYLGNTPAVARASYIDPRVFDMLPAGHHDRARARRDRRRRGRDGDPGTRGGGGAGPAGGRALLGVSRARDVGRPERVRVPSYEGCLHMSLLATLPVVQFVIGLREGVEAALDRRHRRHLPAPEGRATRCAGCGPASRWPSRVCLGGRRRARDRRREPARSASRRPSRRSSASIAVAMVTLHDRLHAPPRPRARRRAARQRGAGARGRLGVSLVVMAFLAVMREGLETAMFLLAAFQSSIGVSPLGAGLGALPAARRRRHRLGDLPRRRAPQPAALLPHHRGRCS